MAQARLLLFFSTPHEEGKGAITMANFFIRTVRLISILSIIFCLTATISCNREQPSSSSQTPASTAPSPAASAPAPAPATPAPSVAPAPQAPGQIQIGMTTEQVRQLLGNPSKIEQEGQMVEWKYYTPQGKVEIYFQADRVASVKNK
jgi:type IV secretory pathway VirB10-like protein